MGVIWNKEQRKIWETTQVRPCRACKEVKSWEAFGKGKNTLFGVNSICKACRKPRSKQQYQNWSNEYRLFHAAKSRARSNGIDFDIELSDLVIPELCPVFKVPLIKKSYGPIHWNSPSIDRKDPKKGYVKGNVTIMSWRANMLKNDMSLEEAKMLTAYLSAEQGGVCEF